MSAVRFTLALCYCVVTAAQVPDRARELMNRGDYRTAAVLLQERGNTRTADPDGHAVLGLVLHSAGRASEARPELNRALQLQPGSVEAAAKHKAWLGAHKSDQGASPR